MRLAMVQLFEEDFHRGTRLLAEEMDEGVFGGRVGDAGLFLVPDFQSIGLNVEFERFAVVAQGFDDPENLALLLRRCLLKLDAHSEFGVREANHAACPHSGIRAGDG